jgi:hypothetical protein
MCEESSVGNTWKFTYSGCKDHFNAASMNYILTLEVCFFCREYKSEVHFLVKKSSLFLVLLYKETNRNYICLEVHIREK